VVKGRPGLDDRQLYGGIYPTANHFQWVDGPLAQAWRLAQETPVVLLIDELARLDPYHLAALIGALDRLSGAELRAVLDQDELAAITGLDDTADYYLLQLPNGDRLLAPCRHLTIVATTNLGSDYVQVQTSFDAALLRRFAVQLQIERLEAEVRQQAMMAYGVTSDLAERMTALEDYTTIQTGAHGGLLQRELNLGTVLAWAEEGRALVDEGLCWDAALTLCLPYTVAPFCCPRLSDGSLETAAIDVLLDAWQTLLSGGPGALAAHGGGRP
jgi:nitric oxide reductase NorQ protein